MFWFAEGAHPKLRALIEVAATILEIIGVLTLLHLKVPQI